MAVLALLLLAFVRLLSERSVHISRMARSGSGRERLMATDEKQDSTTDKMKGERRSFIQYLLETAWTCGTGVMAAYWLA